MRIKFTNIYKNAIDDAIEVCKKEIEFAKGGSLSNTIATPHIQKIIDELYKLKELTNKIS